MAIDIDNKESSSGTLEPKFSEQQVREISLMLAGTIFSLSELALGTRYIGNITLRRKEYSWGLSTVSGSGVVDREKPDLRIREITAGDGSSRTIQLKPNSFSVTCED